jgi:hypothetical protein
MMDGMLLFRRRALFGALCGLAFGLSAPQGALAFEECVLPEGPNVPDGLAGNEAELLKIQKQVKEFVAKADGYLACTEREQAKAQALALRSSLPFSAAEQQIWANRYNAGIDAQVKVADRFNAEVKVWRAKSAEAKSDPAKK